MPDPKAGGSIAEPTKTVTGGGDPACGLARGRWALARLIQRQPASQRCDGHLHALVVPEVALVAEFLVEDHRVVFPLVPALLQVVAVGIQGGWLAGWAAHDLLPGADVGVLVHRAECRRARTAAGHRCGVGRACPSKWKNWYDMHGEAGLQDHPSVPLSSPPQTHPMPSNGSSSYGGTTSGSPAGSPSNS